MGTTYKGHLHNILSQGNYVPPALLVEINFVLQRLTNIPQQELQQQETVHAEADPPHVVIHRHVYVDDESEVQFYIPSQVCIFLVFFVGQG